MEVNQNQVGIQHVFSSKIESEEKAAVIIRQLLLHTTQYTMSTLTVERVMYYIVLNQFLTVCII